LVLESDGTTYTEDLTDCDASDSGIMSNMYCDLPMASLWASPYLLSFGETVYAKVAATNAIGQGDFSSPNSASVTVETVPIKLTTLARDNSLTTETNLQVEWTALTGDDTGGPSIDSYHVQWSAYGAATWSDL
jgi:hypothetical protein